MRGRAWQLTALVAIAGAIPLRAQVGEVAFANSGNAAAQPELLHGLALLHDFEYEDAAASFRAAQQKDPAFAMAYWGEAMTYNHPVWMQQDLAAARAVLQRLAPTAAGRQAKAPTERERAYLQALEVLYGEGSKEQRDIDYAASMRALHERFPDDVDATAFYALALLGTSHDGRDFATYMRAAALLEEVFPTHQHHPGVLHYLIHCYDDAVHAPLGVRAARLYGAVAPDAAHALHMTSHIFIALGEWDEVIAANERAMAVVDRRLAAAGQPARHCGHYVDWLFYAYLQAGRDAAAGRELERCRQDALVEERAPEKIAHPDSSSIAEYAKMRLQLVADTGRLPAASVSVPAGGFGSTRFTLAYANALAAATRADAEALRQAVGRLAAAQQEIAAEPDRSTTGVEGKVVAVVRQQVDGLLLLADGKRDAGLEQLARAAEAEEAIPLVFGPPAVEKPGRELLGEQLLAAGRASEAEQAFHAGLARAPGRTVALRGLLSAQRALGERDAAAATQARLDRNLQGATAAGASR